MTTKGRKKIFAEKFKMLNLSSLIKFMRGNSYWLIIAISFICLAAVFWIIQGQFPNIFPALVTLFSVFIGAALAFYFQRNKEIEATKRKNVSEGKVAIFNISQMVNRLRTFQQQRINPVRTSELRFIEILPLPPPTSFKDILVRLDGIYYLLDKEDKDIKLLGKIDMVNFSYQNTVDVINIISSVHIKEVQPALEKAGISNPAKHDIKEIKNALGERLYDIIKEGTDQVVTLVDDTILSLLVVGGELTQSLKKIYPKEKRLVFSIPEQKQIKN